MVSIIVLVLRNILLFFLLLFTVICVKSGLRVFGYRFERFYLRVLRYKVLRIGFITVDSLTLDFRYLVDIRRVTLAVFNFYRSNIRRY